MTQYRTNYNETYPIPDSGAQMNLAMNVALTYTVPGASTKMYRAQFEYNATSNVWVGFNVTAVVPGAGTIADAYKQEFRPGQYGDGRYVKGGDEISLITSDAAGAQVGISLLEVPSQSQ